MNIFKRIFSCSGGSGGGTRPAGAGRVYIIDATGLVTQRRRDGGGDQGNPREHAHILKELVRFGEREKLDVKVVFTGRPLREASDGAEHRGVTVYYAENRENLKTKISALVNETSRGKQAVVLTSDQDVERAVMSLRAECMRLTTFKKALESRDEKERPQTRNSNSSRSSLARESRPGNNATSREEKRDTAVLTLIDPI